MSTDYEREQAGLQVSVEELRESVAACEQQSVNMDSFLKLVKKYTVPDKLFPRNANILMNTLQRISAFCISAQSHGRFKKYPDKNIFSIFFAKLIYVKK